MLAAKLHIVFYNYTNSILLNGLLKSKITLYLYIKLNRKPTLDVFWSVNYIWVVRYILIIFINRANTMFGQDRNLGSCNRQREKTQLLLLVCKLWKRLIFHHTVLISYCYRVKIKSSCHLSDRLSMHINNFLRSINWLDTGMLGCLEMANEK